MWILIVLSDDLQEIRASLINVSEEQVLQYLKDHFTVKPYEDDLSTYEGEDNNETQALKKQIEKAKKATSVAEVMREFDGFRWGEDNRRVVFVIGPDGKEVL